MRPDGSVINERGYDPETQLWCEPDADLTMPVIDAAPSREQAEVALELLRELLAGFEFVADKHRSVALAAIMTTVLRGAFDMAPLFLLLAHVAGTGKSFLADLISTIVRGRPCPVISASQNQEEMEKRLGSLLLEGPPIISIDNISFDLESDLLCQMTTQQIVKTRILGKSLTPECEWRGVVFVTGNNVRLVGDLTRRGLVCSMDANVEQPELREFEFNPIERVLKDRGSYIAAAITVAKAWLAAGSPAAPGVKPLAGFAEWCSAVRLSLIWLGDAARAGLERRAASPRSWQAAF
jgi:putative DNA primase/helicase